MILWGIFLSLCQTFIVESFWFTCPSLGLHPNQYISNDFRNLKSGWRKMCGPGWPSSSPLRGVWTVAWLGTKWLFFGCSKASFVHKQLRLKRGWDKVGSFWFDNYSKNYLHNITCQCREWSRILEWQYIVCPRWLYSELFGGGGEIGGMGRVVIWGCRYTEETLLGNVWHPGYPWEIAQGYKIKVPFSTQRE